MWKAKFGLCPELSWRTWISSFCSTSLSFSCPSWDGGVSSVTGPVLRKSGHKVENKGFLEPTEPSDPSPGGQFSASLLLFCASVRIEPCPLFTLIDLFFNLLSLHVSLHWASMILALLFLQTHSSFFQDFRQKCRQQQFCLWPFWWLMNLSSDSTLGFHLVSLVLKALGLCQGEKCERCLHAPWTETLLPHSYVETLIMEFEDRAFKR